MSSWLVWLAASSGSPTRSVIDSLLSFRLSMNFASGVFRIAIISGEINFCAFDSVTEIRTMPIGWTGRKP